jgi:hypothetical protein
MDVKVSVVSCFNEILRITAPCQPYDDEKIKVSILHTASLLPSLSASLVYSFTTACKNLS